MDFLLALLADKTLREVRLEAETFQSVATLFDEAARKVLAQDTEVHPYAPGFKPDDDGVMELVVELPASLARCAASLPADVARLDGDALRRTPPIALVAVTVGASPRFALQALDARHLLTERRALFFGPDGFELSKARGITLASRLDALWIDGRLYFKSEHAVRHLLGLEERFEVASDADIATLFEPEKFVVADWNALKRAVTLPLRRKLHGVLRRGAIASVAVLKAAASRAGVDLVADGEAIVVPSERPAMRDFVRLLDDAYLESLLDADRVYLTTSKRAVR